MNDRTVVAVGCSRDPDYSFLLPLTCLLWRDRVGFRPIALLTRSYADWSEDPRARVVLRALFDRSIDYRFVGDVPGRAEHTVAQNCRQHAAAIEEIEDDYWVMPGDADLWPLFRSHYRMHEGTQFKAVCYYANGDHFSSREEVLGRAAAGLRSQTLPTCHVAMRARDWRTIYALVPGDVAGSLENTLSAWLAQRSQEDTDSALTLWCADQQIMTEALCHQSWFPRGELDLRPGVLDTAHVRFISREGHPPVDRIDRAVPGWSAKYGEFDPTWWVDAHVHRAPYSDEHWADEFPIFETLLPQHAKWAREYREAYVAAGRNP